MNFPVEQTGLYVSCSACLLLLTSICYILDYKLNLIILTVIVLLSFPIFYLINNVLTYYIDLTLKKLVILHAIFWQFSLNGLWLCYCILWFCQLSVGTFSSNYNTYWAHKGEFSSYFTLIFSYSKRQLRLLKSTITWCIWWQSLKTNIVSKLLCQISFGSFSALRQFPPNKQK